MYKTITFEEAIQLKRPIYIDVRSPGEYAAGHIVGAVNVPLLNDNERVDVGVIYHKEGPDPAKDTGLTIISNKLPDIIRQIRDLGTAGRPLIVYCWRGGMRSKSVVSVLSVMGIPAMQLIGGYKSYRRHILDSLQDFELKPKVVVLCGSTGVGKTALLKLLSFKNIPVIDLENLANHRGSVFGQVGLGAPETAQNFDAKIYGILNELKEEPVFVVECESKRVGNVYLPKCLYQGMDKGIKILLTADIDIRISRLIAEYTDGCYEKNAEEILTSLNMLSKRLGMKKTSALVENFQQGNIHQVVYTLLTEYYDPLYGYEREQKEKFDFIVDCSDLNRAATAIFDYLNQLVNK
jgi:tRNA 2-selenouridine synthase